MTDITVSRGKHRCYLIPESPKGKKWIDDNIDAGVNILAGNYVAISVEYMEEMIKTLEEAELVVSVKT